MSDTKTALYEMVRDTAEEITNGFEGELNDDGDPQNAYDYISEAMDITYHVGSDGNFKGGEFAVSIGGPNIYVNVTGRYVVGYWGSDKFEWSFDDSPGLYDAMEEFYEMTR